MCSKKIWTWLISMMMSGAMPGGDTWSEAIVSSENEKASIEKGAGLGSFLGAGNQGKWCYGEPKVADLLADPIVQMLMRSDRVSMESLAVVLNAARKDAVTKDKPGLG